MTMCGQDRTNIEQIDNSKAVSQQYLSPCVYVSDRAATTKSTGPGVRSSVICDSAIPESSFFSLCTQYNGLCLWSEFLKVGKHDPNDVNFKRGVHL